MAFQALRRFSFLAIGITHGRGVERVTTLFWLTDRERDDLVHDIEKSLRIGGTAECFLGVSERDEKMTAIPLDGVKPKRAKVILQNTIAGLEYQSAILN
jgi:hypothetical protein